MQPLHYITVHYITLYYITRTAVCELDDRRDVGRDRAVRLTDRIESNRIEWFDRSIDRGALVERDER